MDQLPVSFAEAEDERKEEKGKVVILVCFSPLISQILYFNGKVSTSKSHQI